MSIEEINTYPLVPNPSLFGALVAKIPPSPPPLKLSSSDHLKAKDAEKALILCNQVDEMKCTAICIKPPANKSKYIVQVKTKQTRRVFKKKKTVIA